MIIKIQGFRFALHVQIHKALDIQYYQLKV